MRYDCRYYLWILSSLLLFHLGCGEAPPLETHPVRGQILVDGQPAENAFVVLIPKQTIEGVETLSPRAFTDAQGYFDLATFASGDGAPTGKYYVGVEWRKAPPDINVREISSEVVKEFPDVLKGKYVDPSTSGLEATIVPEVAELPPFQLSTSK